MKIDFLYFDGCPNHETALALLKKTLKEESVSGGINMIKIKNGSDAEEHRFLGSPSIHINGEDIEVQRKNDKPLYGCRIYAAAGVASGVPPEEMIRSAVRLAKLKEK